MTFCSQGLGIEASNHLGVLMERGHLSCSNQVGALIPKNGRIDWMIEEGRWVEQGELLAVLDGEDLRENIENLKGEISQLEEDLELLVLENQMKQEKNMRSLEINQSELDNAKLNLNDFIAGASPHERRLADIQILKAEIELEKKQSQLERQASLVEKGFSSRTSLEPLEIALQSAELSLETKRRTRAEMDEDPLPEKLEELKAEVEKWTGVVLRFGERSERKVRIDELAEQEKHLELDIKRKRLRKMNQELNNTKVFASKSGLVKATKRRDWSKGGGMVKLSVGTKVYKNDKLCDLVDPSRVVVTVNVHESDANKVEVGQQAEVEVPAIGLLVDKALRGEVSYVSAICKDMSVLSPSDRLYAIEHGQGYFRVVVDVLEERKDYLPGMSAWVSLPFGEHEGSK